MIFNFYSVNNLQFFYFNFLSKDKNFALKEHHCSITLQGVLRIVSGF